MAAPRTPRDRATSAVAKAGAVEVGPMRRIARKYAPAPHPEPDSSGAFFYIILVTITKIVALARYEFICGT
jgi:hypothetical protein